MRTAIPFFAALLLMTSTAVQAADNAGTVGYMSGALVAQRADGTVKVLAPKSEILPGDMLITAKDSYAQVKMNDGSQMTLRPNSNLRIEAFQFNKEVPQSDNMVLRLLKGGFRTVTGMIGKRGNADAYRVRAASATIGIRGTDFSSRLCVTKDCKDDDEDAAKKMSAKPQPISPRVIGRVMLVQGELSAKETDDKVRKLILGGRVYEGDTLTTGSKSHAVVAFRDEGRVTLQENTVFQVEKFKYDKTASQENAVLRLLKGGVRVVTGLIGRANHDNYQFKVSSATIGIRGTGFDAWCNGPCAKDAANPLADADEPKNDDGVRQAIWSHYAEATTYGVLSDAGVQTSAWMQYAEAPASDPMDGAGVYVWAGEVVLVSPGGSLVVAVQQAAIIAHDTGKPIRIITVPQSIIDNSAPLPTTIPAEVDKLFGSDSNSGDPGLYVTVHEGQVVLVKGENSLDLGRGETGFTQDDILTRLATTPGFMDSDPQMDPTGKNIKPDNKMPEAGCKP